MNVINIILNSIREQATKLKTFELKNILGKFLDLNFIYKKENKKSIK